jgi:uncharacterized protein (TIGR00661 family)
MRVLYGVVGEGMGHAMRSRVVLEHLVSGGHRVQVMASGRAVAYLKERFPDVNEIHGFHIVYEQGRVKRGKTLVSNLFAGSGGVPKNVRAYFELVDDFEPEIVISDFESWTHAYGRLHEVPVLSVDNMQLINRCKIPKDVTAGDRADFEIARAIVKSKVPGCAHYFVTTFFDAKIRRKRTSLHPPILRPEILAATPTTGQHLLVYQTAEGNDELASTLAATGLECRIYGMRRGLTDEVVEGNLRYRPFSETAFIDDLASARGVLASGGFTLMSECVYLGKPMLAVPVGRQFEQVLNSKFLEREGYGVYAPNLDDPRTVHDFVERIPACEHALASYAQDGNQDLLEAVDRHLT